MAVKCEAYVISDVLISRFKKPLCCPELTGPVPAQMRRDNSRAIHYRFCITFRGMWVKGTLRSPISQLLPIPIFLDCGPERMLLRIRQRHKWICNPKRAFRAAVILYHWKKLSIKTQRRYSIYKYILPCNKLKQRAGIDSSCQSRIDVGMIEKIRGGKRGRGRIAVEAASRPKRHMTLFIEHGQK